MAENAASQLYKALVIKGHPIQINWAKPRAQAYVEGGGSGGSSSSSSSSSGLAMLPPPGMEYAPASTYALPGLPQPVLRPPEPSGSSSSSSGGGYFISNPPSAAGVKRGAGEMSGEGVGSVVAPQQKKAVASNQYPSMNPSRMGAKI